MKAGNKIIAAALSIMLAVGLFPGLALARGGVGTGVLPEFVANAETSIVDSGIWGSEDDPDYPPCAWTLDSNGTLTVGPGRVYYAYYDSTPWKNAETAGKIKVIKFVADGANKVIPPDDSSSLFAKALIDPSVTEIDFSGMDFSNVTDMSGMFNGCAKLTKITWPSDLDTSNVVNMSNLFYECKALKTLDLSKFTVSKVTDMSTMFMYCTSLTSLDLSSFSSMEAVENMRQMFSGCKKLATITYGESGGFDISAAIDLTEMFSDCANLKTAPVLKASKVTEMPNAFSGCSSMQSIDMSKFDTSNVANMSGAFAGCKKLVGIGGLSGFNTENVKWVSGLFSGCASLTSLDLRSFNLSNAEDNGIGFDGCAALKSIQFPESGFVPTKATGLGSMFSGCKSLTSLDLKSFDTSNVTGMTWMFSGCTSLETLDISSFNTSKVKGWQGFQNMFAECPSLAKLTLGKNAKLRLGSQPAESGLVEGSWKKGNTSYATKSKFLKATESGLEGTWVRTTKMNTLAARASSLTYSGKALTPKFSMKCNAYNTMTLGKQFTISKYLNAKKKEIKASAVKNAGTYYAVLKGVGAYSGTLNAKFTIGKKANPFTVKALAPSVKFNKSKSQTIAVKKAFSITKTGFGPTTYAKKSGNANIKVAKNGTITVNKGLKSGSYSVKVTVKSAGNVNYKPVTRTVTVKVTVKK